MIVHFFDQPNVRQRSPKYPILWEIAERTVAIYLMDFAKSCGAPLDAEIIFDRRACLGPYEKILRKLRRRLRRAGFSIKHIIFQFDQLEILES